MDASFWLYFSLIMFTKKWISTSLVSQVKKKSHMHFSDTSEDRYLLQALNKMKNNNRYQVRGMSLLILLTCHAHKPTKSYGILHSDGSCSQPAISFVSSKMTKGSGQCQPEKQQFTTQRAISVEVASIMLATRWSLM